MSHAPRRCAVSARRPAAPSRRRSRHEILEDRRLLTGEPSATLIDALYQSVFHRGAEPQALDYWSKQLASAINESQFAADLLASHEYHQDLVGADYTQLLGRTADKSGLDFWISKLDQQQLTSGQVLAGIAGSSEYFDLQHDSNTQFIVALYHDLLDRLPDGAEQNYWLDQLSGAATGKPSGHAAAPLSRAEVAQAFLSTPEYQSLLVAGFYHADLSRAPDPSGMSYWAGKLEQGASPETIAAGILSSQEYVHRTASPSGPTVKEHLADDTAPGGGTNNDGITSDPTIAGQVTDTSPIANLKAGFDGAAPASFGSVFAELRADDTFTLDPATLAQVFGGPIPDGPHTLHLQATDNNGNASPVVDLAFTLDTAGPSVSISAPAAGSITGGNETIKGTALDATSGVDSLAAAVDGGPFAPVASDSSGNFTFATALPLTGAADGPHTVHFKATDKAGNVSQATDLTFMLDTQPPAISITNPTSGTFVNQNQTIAGKVADAQGDVASLAAAVDGGSFAPVSLDSSGNFTFATALPLNGASDGPHAVRFKATDKAGNASAPTDFNFTLDTQDPAINITSPAINAIENQNPTIVGNLVDAQGDVASFTAALDGGAAVPVSVDSSGHFAFTTALPLTGAADGKHTVLFKAVDKAGNESSMGFTVTLDTKPPTISITSPVPGAIVNQNQVIAGKVTDAQGDLASLTAAVDGGPFAPVTVDSSGNFTFTTALPLTGTADGPHAVHFKATDQAGNISPLSDFSLTLDTQPPAISITSPPAGAIVNQNQTIAGKVTDPQGDLASLTAAVDGGPFAPVTVDSSGNFTFATALPLTGAADGPHTVHFNAVDKAGNVSPTSDLTFTLDTRLPVIAITSPTAGAVTNQNEVFSGKVTDTQADVSSLTVAVDGGAFAPVSFDTSGNFTFTTSLPLSGAADGPHTVHFKAVDKAGNVSLPSDLTFTLDTQPPAITVIGPTSGAVTNQNETIAGTVADAVSGVASLQAAVDAGAYSAVTVDPSGNFRFATLLAGDGSADGAHTVHLKATDKAGNVSSPTDLTFTLDTIAPAITITGPTAGQTVATNETITGSATDAGSGLATLQAAVDAGAFAAVTTDASGNFSYTTSLVLGGAGDGPHTVHFKATDKAGNVSKVTDFAFTLDSAPPKITAFDLSPGSETGTPGDHTTSYGRVTLVGVTKPAAQVTLAGTTMSALASATGAFQFPDVALTTGDNTFNATATDAEGLTAQTQLVVHRTAPSNQTDPVIAWNQNLLAAIRQDASDPQIASRAMAMVQSAVYDAVNAVEGKPGHFVTLTSPVGASAPAAVSQAAHDVLAYLYPAQQAAFDTELTSSLAQVADGQSKTDGVGVGQAAAAAIIALRAGDGWNKYVDYTPGSGPGVWVPTAPMFAEALEPQWAQLTPWTMTSDSEFRPAGPPALTSAAWAAAVNETQSLGSATSTTRTADQKQIALFWKDGGGTATPPGHWNEIAEQVAAAQGDSLDENARLFAELDVALADAAIVAWDAKYAYNTWRPITAIQNADSAGNSAVTQDPNWTPLIVSPPFPEYISGHSTFSGTAATILDAVFGPSTSFTAPSDTLAGVTRSFTGFDQAAAEAGMSRIYGGIHFTFSDVDGRASGAALAKHVLASFNTSQDTVPPTITITSAASGFATHTDPTITGRVTDNLSGAKTFTAALDGGAFAPVTFDASGNFTLPVALATDGSADGPHVVHLQATDFAGNTSTVLDVDFTLDTKPPAIAVTSPAAKATLTAGAALTGTADPTGSALASLTYTVDGGTSMPLTFDSTGAFNQPLDLSKLGAGNHTLVVSAADAAGNTAQQTVAFSLAAAIPLTVTTVTPQSGATDVGVTYRPQVFFSRAIDTSTLAAADFYATDTTGAVVPSTIVPSNDGTFAWLFFTNPLPGASTITVTVDGSHIKAADGALLDAADSGTAGSKLTWQFTTVNTAPVPGTSLTGIVADPGPDLLPDTTDDVSPGPDGVLMTADDVYKLPIAHVKVYLLGHEDQAVYTAADGSFTLSPIPTGDVKLALEGMTATNAPTGFYFANMVMDLHIKPGVVNTVMASMATSDAKAAANTELGVYLPRLRTALLQSVANSQTTTINVDPGSAPNLTPDQQKYLSVAIPSGSLIGPDGKPLSSAQIGISTVPPELVQDMLPQGIMQLATTLTLQAPSVTTFSSPVALTFPNVYGAAPGTKLDFYSFDHTTGKLVITGTATVSADGKSATTDPDSGIIHPGWFGITPPGSQNKTHPKSPCRDGGEAVLQGLEDLSNGDQGIVKALSGTKDIVEEVGGDLFKSASGLFKAFGITDDLATLLNSDKPWYERVGAASSLLATGLEAVNPEVSVPIWLAFRITKMIKAADDVYEGVNKLKESVSDIEKMASSPPCGSSGGGGDPSGIDNSLNSDVASLETELSQELPELNSLQSDDQGIYGILQQADPSQVDLGLSSSQISQLSNFGTAAGTDITQIDQQGPFWDNLATIQGDISSLSDLYSEPTYVGPVGLAASGGTRSDPVLYWSASIGNSVLRGLTDPTGAIQFFAPPNQLIVVQALDPKTNEIGTLAATSGVSGTTVDLGGILMLPDTGADTTGDGLSDAATAILGITPQQLATTLKGINVGAELQQGLDPLNGVFMPTGVIATLPVQGTAEDVALSGSILNSQQDTAYVATGSYGLSIVDVSQFTNPKLLGQLKLTGNATSVAVDSSLEVAAVATNAGGLQLVDVATPASAQLMQTVPIDATDVVANDGVAYASRGDEVVAVDMLTGDILGRYSYNGGSIDDMAIADGYLYTVAHSSTEPHTVNKIALAPQLAAPISSVVIDGHPTFGRLHIFAGGGYVYVGAADNNDSQQIPGVEVIQDGQAGLKLVGPSSGITAFDVAVNESGLALFTGASPGLESTAEVAMLDLSDPTKTDRVITIFPTPGVARSVAIAAGMGFVADGSAGLAVLNYLPFDTKGVPPTVTLDTSNLDTDPNTPGIQAVEGSRITLNAKISDDVQVRNVEVLVNGNVVSNSVSFPFDLSTYLPTIAAAGKTVTVQVSATDTGGNTTTTPPVTLNLVRDTMPPKIVRQNPPDGGTVGQQFRALTIDFSKSLNPATIAAADFEIDGPSGAAIAAQNVQLRLRNSEVQITFPAGTLPVGDYKLVVHAANITDTAGNALGASDLTTKFHVAQYSEVWTNANGGNWSDPANWDSGKVPGAGDDVLIDVPGSPTITFDSAAGTVDIRSLVAKDPFTIAGGTLIADQSLEVDNAFTVAGGTLKDTEVVASSGGEAMTATGGNSVLDGVTLDRDLTVNGGASLAIFDGLVLNGTLTVGGDNSYGYLYFHGTQTLSGSGKLALGGKNGNGYVYLNGQGGPMTLTVAAGTTVHGIGQISDAAYSNTLLNQGQIEADVSSGTLTVDPSAVNNQGTMAASGGGSLNIGDLTGNLGTGVSVSGAGSTFDLNGSGYTIDQGLTAPAGTTLSLGGTWSNAVGSTISATGATLNLGDQNGNSTNGWTNAGTISATQSTVNLGGAFTMVGLGAFNRSGGAVNLVGTLDLAPLPPSELSASAGTDFVALSWLDLSKLAEGYSIERSTDGVNFSQIGAVPANVSGYVDTGVAAGTKYTYRVRAYNAVGDSPYSNIASAAPTAAAQGLLGLYYNLSTTPNGVATAFDTVTGAPTANAALAAASVDAQINVPSNNNGFVAPSTAPGVGADNVGVEWMGQIQIAQAGTYTFYSASDDGSLLYIDGNLAVSNDGVHGVQDGTSTPLALTAGMHTMLELYEQGYGGAGIEVDYQGPDTGGKRVMVPASTLFNPADALPTNPPGPGVKVVGGDTLALNAATGSWNLRGGTVRGGTLSEAGGAKLIFTDRGGLLDGVNAAGDLDLTTMDNANVHLVDGLTLSNATVMVGNAAGTTYGNLYFDGTQTLDGSGAVLLGKSGNNSIYETAYNGALTFGPDVTVHGSSGTVGAYYNNGTIVNQGTIAADDSGGGSFGYDAGFNGGFTVSTADAIDTSGAADPAPQEVYQTARQLNGSSYTLSGLTPGAKYTVRLYFADFQSTAAGQRVFDVSVNGVQVLSNFDIFSVAGGKDKAVDQDLPATADGNGQVTLAFNATRGWAQVNGIAVLSGATVVQTINAGLLPGGTITVNPSTFENQGSLQASNGESLNISGLTGNVGVAALAGVGSSLTLGGTNYVADRGLTAPAGTTLTLNGTWTNPAGSTINTSGATLDLGDQSSNSTNAWTNVGTLSVTNSTVNLGGEFTLKALGMFNRTGGTVNLVGTLDLSPVSPTQLSAEAGTNFVALSWLNRSKLASGYSIERSSDGVNFSQIGAAPANASGFLDSGLTAGTKYTYRVRAYNAVGDSPYTNTASATPTAAAQGLLGLYYNLSTTPNGVATAFDTVTGAPTANAALAATSVDAQINVPDNNNGFVAPSTAPGVGADNVGVEWMGQIQIAQAGTYMFYSASDDGSLLYIDGQLAVSNDGTHGVQDGTSTPLALTAGLHKFLELYEQDYGGAGVEVDYQGPDTGGKRVMVPASALFNPAGALPTNAPGPVVKVVGGDTLALNATTGSWNLLGGTVRGGTLSEAGGAKLIFTDRGGLLDGVNVASDLDLTTMDNANVHLVDGLTLDNATVLVGNAAGTTYGNLYFDGNQALDGSGAVLFGKSGNNSIYETAYNGALTFGPSITVRGSSGTIGAYNNGTIVNQGAIAADDSGGGSFGYDSGFNGGFTSSTADTIDTSGVTDPAPQEVYQTARQLNGSNYTLSGLTPGAKYTVRLYFADFESTAAGQRVFDVSVNGVQALANFDIFAAAGGKDKAVDQDLSATADGNGQVMIAFNATQGWAQVNGIAVLPGTNVVQTINAGLLPGGTITVNPSTFENQGSLQTSNGESLNISGLTGNVGVATLAGVGSSLTLGGTNYVVDRGLTAPAGTTLTLNGTWTNAAGSTISASGATLNLGDQNDSAATSLASVRAPRAAAAAGAGTNVSIAATGPATGSVGQNVTYTITVSNNSATSSATGVVLTDTLPTSATFVSATDASGGFASTSGGVLTDLIGSLAAGATDTITIVVDPTAAGTITDTAAVAVPGNTSSATTASVSTAIDGGGGTALVDLSIIATASPGKGHVGQNETLTFDVTNNSTAGATGVTVTSMLPADATFVSAVDKATGAALTPSGGALTDTVGTLAAGASDSITVVLTPSAAGTLAESAAVAADQTDPNQANNSATASVTVVNPYTWLNSGDISATNSTVNLGGALTVSSLGTFNRTGGTVSLVGLLDNTDNSLSLNTTTGSWRLAGGTIRNGTLVVAAGTSLVFTDRGGTLDGITAAGDLDLTGADDPNVHIVDRLTLNNATLRLGNAAGTSYGNVYFDGTQTLGGTGTVLFGKSGGNLYETANGDTLTIGPNITVRGSSGTVGSYGNGTIVNQGAISADDSGGGSFGYDTGYNGGYSASTADSIDTSGVTNAAPQEVYQTARQLNGSSYTFRGLTPGASYTVRLYFADFQETAAGQRVFNVSVNGTQALANYDIVAAAGGKDKAIDKDLSATADSNGQIAIKFDQVSGAWPQVNGIAMLSGATVVQTINAGLLPGGTITISPTAFTNQGTLNVSNGETLNVQGAWTNAAGATVNANGATLNLGDESSSATNAWTNAGTIAATNSTVNLGGAITLAGLGAFNRTGGTVNLLGALDDTKTTLALNATTGSWNLAGGRIKNGTLSEAGGAELVFTNRGGTLDGVTASGDLDLTGADDPNVHVVDGLTLDSATMRLGNAAGTTYGNVYFDGTQTLGGTGTVLLGKSGGNALYETAYGGTLTIGANVAVRGSDGTLGSYGNGTIVNQGTISADDSGGGSFGYDTGFNGGYTASAGDTIDTSGVANAAPQEVYQTARQLNGSSYTLAGLTPGAAYTVRLYFADFQQTAAGQRVFNVNVNGTQALANFDIFAAAGGKDKAIDKDLAATADGKGQITIEFDHVSGAWPQVNGIALLSGANIVQTINAGLLPGGTITINPTTFTNQGTLNDLNGETLNVQGAWTNAAGATVSANSATLNLGDQYSSTTNAWTNAGTIAATNSTVNLGGAITLAGLGTFNRTGGTVNFVGALDNTKTTLALNATTGSWNLVGGTIKNGTIGEAGGAELVFTDRGGTLDGVTASGDLDLTGADDPNIHIVNGLTLNNATLRLGNAAGTTYGLLYFDGTQALGGTGTVLFGKDGSSSLYETAYGGTLTIGPNVTIRGSSGTIGSYGNGTVVSQGAIAADDSGGGTFGYDAGFNGGYITSTADSIDTSGVTNPAPLEVYQTARQLNGSSYTLSGLTTGASYTVRLYFADFQATAAGQRVFNVSVNGTQALPNFDIFAAAGGKDKAIDKDLAATPDGNGQITIKFDQVSGDWPQINGLAVLSGTTVVQTINAGLLAGGTITINPTTFTNQGAVSASSGGNLTIQTIAAPMTGTITAAAGGTVKVNGDLTLGSGGTVDVELGGTGNGQAGVLDVTGKLTLDGTLNVSLVGGFEPTSGDTFEVISDGSQAGQFATVNGTSIPNNLKLAVTYNTADVTLVAGAALMADMTGDTPSLQSTPGGSGALAEGHGVRFLQNAEAVAEESAAIQRWAAAGLNARLQALLRSVDISVAHLGGDILGLTAGNRIVLSDNADGLGWFVDPALQTDAAFAPMPQHDALTALAGGSAAGKIDLLTVLMHELGHELGLEHMPGGLMQETLPVGERRQPTAAEVDAVFAGVH